MKTLYTLLTLMFVLTIAKAQTIPNAGFENWTNFGTYSDPTSWSSYNSYAAGSGNFNCEQGMPGAIGTSYLKLTVKAGSVVGTAMAASTPSMLLDLAPGFACNARPVSLTGKWQYLVSTNDTSMAEVFFFKWNPTTMTSDLMGMGIDMITAGSVSSWTNFSIPINYMNGDTPDSALIIFVAGAADNPIVGDYLHIDDLSFAGSGPSGIEVVSEKIKLTIAPNPVTTHAILSFEEEQKNTSINIFDILGNEIKTIHFSGKQLSIEKGTMKEGLYFIQITDEKKQIVNKKIIIQ
jgi:hypothetical protein